MHGPVDTIVLLVSSYQGHTLEWVANAYCRVVDEHDVELARVSLTLGVPETGIAMATLRRDGDRGGGCGRSARASRSPGRPSRGTR